MCKLAWKPPWRSIQSIRSATTWLRFLIWASALLRRNRSSIQISFRPHICHDRKLHMSNCSKALSTLSDSFRSGSGLKTLLARTLLRSSPATQSFSSKHLDLWETSNSGLLLLDHERCRVLRTYKSCTFSPDYELKRRQFAGRVAFPSFEISPDRKWLIEELVPGHLLQNHETHERFDLLSRLVGHFLTGAKSATVSEELRLKWRRNLMSRSLELGHDLSSASLEFLMCAPWVASHGDFSVTNMLVRGEEVVVIDWDPTFLDFRPLWYDLACLLFLPSSLRSLTWNDWVKILDASLDLVSSDVWPGAGEIRGEELIKTLLLGHFSSYQHRGESFIANHGRLRDAHRSHCLNIAADLEA